ncbi:M20 metallopeptidase family protein [Alteribacillus bidgolensis]|uniref:Amidohydrolase n=1 Tax=Alteribacillus bidgolensis TaxID=930129 RepID=A0A1G8K712_9BACI|nr:amidohydrolase [Alteribacillus bidgolensis]SDI39212.1 amidohydrolase [Alteribacillus bidgolensis]
MSTLLAKAMNLQDELSKWRRHLHQYPELGFEEFNTSDFIKERLKEFGITEITKMVGTGLMVFLRGKRPGPTVMLRADIDALPIQDEKTVEYASKINNVAHLCGHDAHTAMMLGAVKILKDMEIETGNIQVIFQPAEEGLSGAKKMIEEDVLNIHGVDAAAALHVQPTLPTGEISVCPNSSTANSDRFVIKVIGKGGHAAHPHVTVDSVAVAAELISSIQHIVSRKINPLENAVISIGKISGGSARNVIAPSVSLVGTVRTFKKEVQVNVKEEMERIISGICQAFGADYQFDYERGYPSVDNDEAMITIFKSTAANILGEDKLSVVPPSMGGEDFSYYTKKVPSLFFRLGVRPKNKETMYSHHHPLFDIDETAMPYGTALLSQFALDFLHHKKVLKETVSSK